MPSEVPQSIRYGVARMPMVRPIESPAMTTPRPIVRFLVGVWLKMSVRSLE